MLSTDNSTDVTVLPLRWLEILKKYIYSVMLAIQLFVLFLEPRETSSFQFLASNIETKNFKKWIRSYKWFYFLQIVS